MGTLSRRFHLTQAFTIFNRTNVTKHHRQHRDFAEFYCFSRKNNNQANDSNISVLANGRNSRACHLVFLDGSSRVFSLFWFHSETKDKKTLSFSRIETREFSIDFVVCNTRYLRYIQIHRSASRVSTWPDTSHTQTLLNLFSHDLQRVTYNIFLFFLVREEDRKAEVDGERAGVGFEYSRRRLPSSSSPASQPPPLTLHASLVRQGSDIAFFYPFRSISLSRFFLLCMKRKTILHNTCDCSWDTARISMCWAS